jgi:hypothetical protein
MANINILLYIFGPKRNHNLGLVEAAVRHFSVRLESLFAFISVQELRQKWESIANPSVILRIELLHAALNEAGPDVWLLFEINLFTVELEMKIDQKIHWVLSYPIILCINSNLS